MYMQRRSVQASGHGFIFRATGLHLQAGITFAVTADERVCVEVILSAPANSVESTR